MSKCRHDLTACELCECEHRVRILESENTAFKAEVERLKGEFEYALGAAKALLMTVDLQKKEADRWRAIAEGAREALENYTNFQPYNGERVWTVGDAGKLAKEALAAFPPSEKSQ